MKRIIVTLVLLAALGGIIWYSGTQKQIAPSDISNGNIEPGSGNTLPIDDTTGFMKLGPNAIYVAEQWPGKEITIYIATLASPGYVVIHESKGGSPGAIIGNSALIETTQSKNIKIELKREVKNGETFIAMLHTEKGVVGFDAETDLPVLDPDGNAIYSIFMINADAPDPATSEIIF